MLSSVCNGVCATHLPGCCEDFQVPVPGVSDATVQICGVKATCKNVLFGYLCRFLVCVFKSVLPAWKRCLFLDSIHCLMFSIPKRLSGSVGYQHDPCWLWTPEGLPKPTGGPGLKASGASLSVRTQVQLVPSFPKAQSLAQMPLTRAGRVSVVMMLTAKLPGLPHSQGAVRWPFE